MRGFWMWLTGTQIQGESQRYKVIFPYDQSERVFTS